MQLEEDGAAMLEDLADAVGRAKARHVACPQHNRHSASPCPLLGLASPRAVEGHNPTRIFAPGRGPLTAKDQAVEKRRHGQQVDLDERCRRR